MTPGGAELAGKDVKERYENLGGFVGMGYLNQVFIHAFLQHIGQQWCELFRADF